MSIQPTTEGRPTRELNDDMATFFVCAACVCLFVFVSSTLPAPPSCPCPLPALPHLTQKFAQNPTTTHPLVIGAASNDRCGPSVRLLRGVKAAGGGDGARRLDALARRLPMERAALEAAAAAGAAEAREWRASVAEQAESVVALGQVSGRRGSAPLQRCFVSESACWRKTMCFETGDLLCPNSSWRFCGEKIADGSIEPTGFIPRSASFLHKHLGGSAITTSHAIKLLCTSTLFIRLRPPHPRCLTTGATRCLERPPPPSVLLVEGPRGHPVRLEQAFVLS